MIEHAPELDNLQPGADIRIEIEGMDSLTARRIAERDVASPLIRHRLRRADHLAHDRRLALEIRGAPRRDARRPRHVLEPFDEQGAALRDLVHGVAGEKLCIAERR